MVLLALILLAMPGAGCEAVQGLEPLLKPGSVLFLGEIHGTNEGPAFAGRAVCAALRSGHAVTVGLEMPKEEEARVAGFLRSEGNERDRTALLAGPFWTDTFQDGRRSKAMFALIEELRVSVKERRPVRVTLLDEPAETSANRSRDMVMADNLQASIELSPSDVFIVLTGNLHSRVANGSMAHLFALGMPAVSVTSLDMAFSQRSAWTCNSGDPASCKARQVRGTGDDRGIRVVLRAGEDGFDGIYDVGTVSASEPAAPRPDPRTTTSPRR